MSEELDAFLAELRAAGQPWSRWGLWGSCAGIAALAALQTVRLRDPHLLAGAMGLTLVLLAASWACLIVAFVKRRRWEKAHPLALPPLAELQGGNS